MDVNNGNMFSSSMNARINNNASEINKKTSTGMVKLNCMRKKHRKLH